MCLVGFQGPTSLLFRSTILESCYCDNFKVDLVLLKSIPDMVLCGEMHPLPEHVMTFLLVELGTSGSLDGRHRLAVKGRFWRKLAAICQWFQNICCQIQGWLMAHVGR
ncbi:hypothetical protein LguiB_032879 [Lonicera macranthoides]